MPKISYREKLSDWPPTQAADNIKMLHCDTVTALPLQAYWHVPRETEAMASAPAAAPFLLIHGGPGSGCGPSMLAWFDLERDTVLCVQQRGTPARGAVRRSQRNLCRQNTVIQLLRDMEHWREQLGIARWQVVGGSWGASLALAYTAQYPQAVSGLLLRGTFLARQRELRDFFRRKAALNVAWQQLQKSLPTTTVALSHKAGLRLLRRVFQNGTPVLRQAVAHAWNNFEQRSATRARPIMAHAGEATRLRGSGRWRNAMRQRVALAQRCTWQKKFTLQAHYLAHGCYFGGQGVLPYVQAVAQITEPFPIQIVHGRHDPICAVTAAHRLAQRLPHAQMNLADAGHLAQEPALQQALRQAVRALAET